MNHGLQAELASFFYPLLIAIVGFFLLQFYHLVKKMNDKLTEILVESGKQDARIEALADRIKSVEEEIKDIKNKLSKY